MAQQRFRVVIADDHPLVADSLARLVESTDYLTLEAVCTDGHGAVAALRSRNPDVAVIEARIPGCHAPDVAREVRRARLTTQILVVTSHDVHETLSRCVRAGVRGIISKSAPVDRVLAAIRAVATGNAAFPADARGSLARGRALAEERSLLSPQERRVLTLSADGLSTAAIAAELYVAQTTVKTHLRQAAQKLGVRGKTAASVAALRQGFIA